MNRFFLLFILMNCLIPAGYAGLSETSFDFGTIEAGSKVSKKVTYTNTSGVTTRLIIDPTAKSKFCSVSIMASQVTPNKKTTLKISCHFTHEGYDQTETARVLIQNDKSQEVATLRMKARTIQNRCNDVDLNHSAPLKDMPVLDQDGTGMCYAFSGTTLVEYELKKKGIKRSLSPIDAGLVFKTKTDLFSSDLSGGLLDLSVNDLKSHGVATRECVDKLIKSVTKETTLTSESFTALMHALHEYKKADGTEDKTDRKIAQTEIIDLCKAHGVNQKELDKLYADLDGSVKSYFKGLLEPCKKERMDALKWKLPEYDHVYLGSNEKLQRKVNDVLTRKHPVNAGVCAEILKEGNPKHVGVEKTLGYRGSKTGEEVEITIETTTTKSKNKTTKRTVTTTTRTQKDLCSPHAVVVTAQRKINGTCQYLLRNSWGASWEGKNLDCACKTKDNYYPDCSKAPKGTSNKVMVGCWVKESTFLKNLTDAGGFN